MAKKGTRKTPGTPRGAKPSARLPAARWRSPVVGGSQSGLGHDRLPPACKFFSNGHPVPVGLTLALDAPVAGVNEVGCEQLSRPTLLIHAQDPEFACCWFSRAIDLGDESGNPAYWMLEKTAKDKWSLCLRRVTGQLAAYELKSKSNGFPIKLKKGKTTRDFKWPATITIAAHR